MYRGASKHKERNARNVLMLGIQTTVATSVRQKNIFQCASWPNRSIRFHWLHNMRTNSTKLKHLSGRQQEALARDKRNTYVLASFHKSQSLQVPNASSHDANLSLGIQGSTNLDPRVCLEIHHSSRVLLSTVSRSTSTSAGKQHGLKPCP